MSKRIEQLCEALAFCFEMMKNFDNGSDERIYMGIAVNAIQEVLDTQENQMMKE